MSLDKIFSEFEGYIDPESTQGSGDVKYHLGATGEFSASNGQRIEWTRDGAGKTKVTISVRAIIKKGDQCSVRVCTDLFPHVPGRGWRLIARRVRVGQE